MKTTANPTEIEKDLHKRLKFMGFLLILFAAVAFVWDMFPAAEDEFEQILLELEEAPPPMNMYVVSSSFAIVGLACLLITWKKR